MPKRTLYFLHGFSGDPEDWNEVISYLPGEKCFALRYPFQIPSDGILIGYSMGGRIALGSSLPKVILSAHPGFLPVFQKSALERSPEASEEKAARALRQQQWIQKLKTVSLSQFFEEWYAQPLFISLRAHPNFPSILKRRLQQDRQTLIHQLEKHPLGNGSLDLFSSSCFIPFFIHGALDETYSNLYQRSHISSYEIPRAGHACHLENPLDTALQIKALINCF